VKSRSAANVQKLDSELKATREKEMADIKEKMSGILTAAGNCGAVELAAASGRLETKFTDVRQQITDNCNKFRQAGENLNSHRSMCLVRRTSSIMKIFVHHHL